MPAKFVKMANGQFQNVGLFQFADVFALGLQGHDHQLLKLVQAPVDPGATFAFQHWFHDLEKTKKNNSVRKTRLWYNNKIIIL